jgi:hypothetical protein
MDKEKIYELAAVAFRSQISYRSSEKMEFINGYTSAYEQLESQLKALQEQVSFVDDKFKSGNSVPVYQVTITRKEWDNKPA